jgi:tetratricopeptide (TPR) repeat protein
MNNIASLLVEEGKHEEAKVELLQAILLLDKPEDHHLQAYLHNNLGKIYDDMILPVLARDEYLKAIQLLDSGSDQELELTVRFNLALVYQSLGNSQDAIDELQRAVEIEEAIGHPNFAADLKLLDKLGEMYEPKVIRWIRKRIIIGIG